MYIHTIFFQVRHVFTTEQTIQERQSFVIFKWLFIFVLIYGFILFYIL